MVTLKPVLCIHGAFGLQVAEFLRLCLEPVLLSPSCVPAMLQSWFKVMAFRSKRYACLVRFWNRVDDRQGLSFKTVNSTLVS